MISVLTWASKEWGRRFPQLTLTGYSFGSYISCKVALRHPDLGRLVLVAPPLSTADFSFSWDMTVPKYVFAASNDEYATKDKLDDWFLKLRPPKSIEVIEGADHFFVGHTNHLIQGILRTIET